MRKKVLIIGNGFDLDLGWKTRYNDFMASDYWPVRKDTPTCPLEDYLAERLNIDRWYDLEGTIKTYATKTQFIANPANPNDEVFFNELRQSLTEYLKQEEKKDVNTESLAVKVLKATIANGYFGIYTFNYTDLNKTIAKTGSCNRLAFEYVHGSVERNSIVIGVDDHTELREGYGYLRKVFSEHYTSHPIRYDLQECDEVVFFGHSLGDNDYPYFYDFFRAQSQCKSRRESKYITIFTKDNRSRIQILEQLRKMNGGQTEHLQNDNVFKLIMTDYPNSVLLDQFFKHLEEDSKSVHNKKMYVFSSK